LRIVVAYTAAALDISCRSTGSFFQTSLLKISWPPVTGSCMPGE
jgi:hypothetical protein